MHLSRGEGASLVLACGANLDAAAGNWTTDFADAYSGAELCRSCLALETEEIELAGLDDIAMYGNVTPDVAARYAANQSRWQRGARQP